MPQDKTLYLPVLVGATQNATDRITYQRDDQGENISNKNYSYNELTAVYWAWKNLKNVDAVGLIHYRRVFLKSAKRSLNNLITQQQIEKMFEKSDVILPTKRHYYIETNYSHYVHAHKQEPLDVTRIIIKQYYPEYLGSFDKIMKKRSAHMFNMFIMKKKNFDDYCTWLFSVLGRLEENIDISEYSVQEKRVFGYISELLMDVWIEQNNVRYTENKWGQLGKRYLIKKAYSFIMRKLGRNENTHF
ncbi:glycosyltransferase [Lactiplantibacillus plantarum]|nr:Glycosyltransferase [Lactiplantibacillus plantarum]KZU58908.1 Glycosyltransferase [Lactiplantibacillus plantarum]MCG0909941.1 hypothetical protein [Lactiplantibacillus plantarum]QHM31580.1 hypothetical protein C7M34_02224 [Lactiplantibacillus plantarum]QHM35476.1 hypothetical protein C7M35_02877 [Lactiplantibacillus plantarum]